MKGPDPPPEPDPPGPSSRELRLRKTHAPFRRGRDKPFTVDWSRVETEPIADPLFEVYATRWLERRVATGLRCVQGYESILRHYLLPAFGPLTLSAITPPHARRFYEELVATRRAPRTVRNVWGLFSTIMKDAVIERLLPSTPCLLRSDERLPNEDASPTWRRRANYGRSEIEALIGDERIPLRHRVAFALVALAGTRSGELSALNAAGSIEDAKPLRRLVIARAWSTAERKIGPTKTREVRLVPIHPALDALLRRWLPLGWVEVFGRAPKPNDPLVPSLTNEGKVVRLRNDRVYRWREKALEILGVRHRRTHDLRRAFVSLCRSDGVRNEIRQRWTHARKSREADELYADTEWEADCAEMLKLRISGLPQLRLL